MGLTPPGGVCTAGVVTAGTCTGAGPGPGVDGDVTLGVVTFGTVIVGTVGTVTVGTGTGSWPGRAAAIADAAPPRARTTTRTAADLTSFVTHKAPIWVRGLNGSFDRRQSLSVSAVKTDYYEVLGVSRDADEESIRKAFHTRARDCHPDVSDSPDDHRQFRELARAYSVLSKPAARLLYDRYGYRGRGNQGFDDKRWDARRRPPRGDNVHLRLELQAYEATEGTRRIVRYEAPTPCAGCDGRGVAGDPNPDCPDCGGSGQWRQISHLDVARILRIEACPRCGADTCDVCDGAGVIEADRRVKVRIPPALEDGAQLRVSGEGGGGGTRGVPGDLLLDIHVRHEPRGSRLIQLLALALFLAALAVLVTYLLR